MAVGKERVNQFDRFWPKFPIFADFGEIKYGKGGGGGRCSKG